MEPNTLLEWCTQPSHGIDPAVIESLIAAGSPLDRALNLAACWDLAHMCARLLAAGADPAARADAGITPLESAAMHGSVDAADVLADEGLHRPSVWLAAATGLMDELASWVGPAGGLVRDPGLYRPDLANVGWPIGEPMSDSDEEILGEALVFAAANNRIDAVDLLLERGVDIDARPYRNTTGLHLAVVFHQVDMVEHLLARGADTTIEDGNHTSTPTGWAVACYDGSERATQIRTLLGTS